MLTTRKRHEDNRETATIHYTKRKARCTAASCWPSIYPSIQSAAILWPPAARRFLLPNVSCVCADVAASAEAPGPEDTQPEGGASFTSNL